MTSGKYQQCQICQTYDYSTSHTPAKCRDAVGEGRAVAEAKADYWRRRQFDTQEKLDAALAKIEELENPLVELRDRDEGE